jgi:hypothetical protein
MQTVEQAGSPSPVAQPASGPVVVTTAPTSAPPSVVITTVTTEVPPPKFGDVPVSCICPHCHCQVSSLPFSRFFLVMSSLVPCASLYLTTWCKWNSLFFVFYDSRSNTNNSFLLDHNCHKKKKWTPYMALSWWPHFDWLYSWLLFDPSLH